MWILYNGKLHKVRSMADRDALKSIKDKSIQDALKDNIPVAINREKGYFVLVPVLQKRRYA